LPQSRRTRRRAGKSRQPSPLCQDLPANSARRSLSWLEGYGHGAADRQPTPCGLNLMRLPPRDLLLARVIVESLEAG